jgi:hypothetical protein
MGSQERQVVDISPGFGPELLVPMFQFADHSRYYRPGPPDQILRADYRSNPEVNTVDSKTGLFITVDESSKEYTYPPRRDYLKSWFASRGYNSHSGLVKRFQVGTNAEDILSEVVGPEETFSVTVNNFDATEFWATFHKYLPESHRLFFATFSIGRDCQFYLRDGIRHSITKHNIEVIYHDQRLHKPVTDFMRMVEGANREWLMMKADG